MIRLASLFSCVVLDDACLLSLQATTQNIKEQQIRLLLLKIFIRSIPISNYSKYSASLNHTPFMSFSLVLTSSIIIGHWMPMVGSSQRMDASALGA